MPQRDCNKLSVVISYLDSLGTFGEQQPDKNEVHISHPTRKVAWENWEKKDGHQVSLEYFRFVWKTHRPHVKIRKHLRYQLSYLI